MKSLSIDYLFPVHYNSAHICTYRPEGWGVGLICETEDI